MSEKARELAMAVEEFDEWGRDTATEAIDQAVAPLVEICLEQRQFLLDSLEYRESLVGTQFEPKASELEIKLVKERIAKYDEALKGWKP